MSSYKPKSLVAFVFAVLAATSGDPTRAQAYIGSGGTSCAEYQAIGQQNPDASQAIDLWILGYLSGLNMMTFSSRKVDLLSGVAYRDVSGFIRGYCAGNPSKTLNNAANEFWFQLADRKGR